MPKIGVSCAIPKVAGKPVRLRFQKATTESLANESEAMRRLNSEVPRNIKLGLRNRPCRILPK
eukprot:5854561-Amphidinium_carterae.1